MFNRYYGYQPTYSPINPNGDFGNMSFPQAQPANDIVWVQGEVGAKSYPVAPGHSVLLMDSENSVFYIKTLDSSGMPLPLRTFDYNERLAATVPPANIPGTANPEYITRQEFDAVIARLTGERGGDANG